MNRQIIDEYEAGGAKLTEAVRGLSDAQLKAFPVPGTWSIQQIIIHLMDSDLIGADRMKRIIAEENPTLIGFDERKFASDLHYDEQSADDAVTVFRLNRKQFAGVLRKLPDEAFERIGTHNERGVIKLGEMLAYFEAHLVHHLKFVRQKRAMLKA